MKKILLSLFGIILLISGCNKTSNEEYILTSIYPIYEMTKNITKDDVKVELLLKNNEHLHDYEASTNDIININESKKFIYISNELETFVPSGDNQLEIVNNEVFNNVNDLHLWTSPKQALLMLDVIKEDLAKDNLIDEKKYQDYKKQLEEINQKYEEFGLTNTKTLIVNHDAFSNLKNDYNINSIGIYGKDGHDEPSIKQINEIINMIKETNIKTIYDENNSEENDILKNIQSETNTTIEVLDNMIANFEENTYLDLLNSNLEKMKQV